MADYGRAVRFGVFPTPDAADLEQELRLVREADARGLDLVGIQDHPYQRRFLDCWMLMATVLARTERLRVFPDVTNLPLPPRVSPKEAAGLDVMSGGRFEFGLGAGAFWGDRREGWSGPSAGGGDCRAGGGGRGDPVDVV